MTDNIHTAEEVRAHANCVAAMALPREAEMLRAYAALLERREAGVTDDVVAKAAHAYTDAAGERVLASCNLDQMRAALLAVWPVAAGPVAQGEDSEQRKAFERWATSMRLSLLRDDVVVAYANAETDMAWSAWIMAGHLLAAHPRAVPDGWQPIEAAPMDIDLLLWWQADLPMDVGIRTETGFQRANDGMGEYDCEPTYWMPLPAAPQPGESQS